jgi:DNA-binding PadR family transcriptional regulator
LRLARELDLWTATVYPALQRLEEAGLVVSEVVTQTDPIRPARRMYQLTNSGAHVAKQLAEEATTSEGAPRVRVRWSM